MAKFYLLVVSDRISRGERRDYSGRRALEIITGSGHDAVKLSVSPNDAGHILEHIREAAKLGVDVVLIIGGTGLGPRDVTVDTLEEIGAKKVPGFGELFRMLTYRREGAKAWLSRASAYIYHNMLIFAVPGSIGAVELALSHIILPEIEHAVEMMRGHSHWGDERREG